MTIARRCAAEIRPRENSPFSRYAEVDAGSEKWSDRCRDAAGGGTTSILNDGSGGGGKPRM